MMELLNLLTFFGLTAGFHVCNEKLKGKFPHTRLTTGHGALVAGALSHPITWDSLQHYVVHLVVYSGYILPKH